jgi:hypothetical protein
VAKLTLTSIGSRYGSIDALNANFQAIEDAIENTLSLDGTAPNGMEVNLDMNSRKIINLADPSNNGDAVSKGWLLEQEGNAAASAEAAALSASLAEDSAVEAAASAAAASGASASASAAAASASTATTQAGIATTQAGNASTSASNASSSASTASTAATNAGNAQTAAEAARDATLAAYDSFDDRYLGSKTSNPTLDNDGNALVGGSLYYNSVSAEMRVYTGSAWVAAYVSGTGFLAAANNLSDLANTGTARTNLGVAIGTNVQAYNANIVVTNAAQTFTALQTFAGSASVADMKTSNILETDTISATAATGTINYDVTTQSVLFYTTNASGNWTLNFRGSSGTSLNTVMQTGESISATFLVTQGATAYYNSVVQIDGSTVTPKWQGGTAPTSGNASAVDCYTFVIQKTGSATYVVLASVTKFA